LRPHPNEIALRGFQRQGKRVVIPAEATDVNWKRTPFRVGNGQQTPPVSGPGTWEGTMQDDARGKPRFKPKQGFKRGHEKGPRKGGPWGKDRRPPRAPEPAEDDGIVRLFGLHPVEAALRNPARVLLGLRATENAANRLSEAIAARGLTPEPVTPRDLDRLLGTDTVHQGLMLEAEPLPEPGLADLAEEAASGGPLILFDQITDPHNAGAILRSAAAFGASGVVTTRRHSPPLNGTLAKSASGALELVKIAQVQNLARAMQELREAGVTILGLDGTATTTLEDEPFTGPVAIVLGAEGKGLRQLTAESCDRLVKITTADDLRSLNVSNAAAIALHTALMRRKGAAR
jgi:23S rRNA (guanosine2251-2'-O)-methyltransferase